LVSSTVANRILSIVTSIVYRRSRELSSAHLACRRLTHSEPTTPICSASRLGSKLTPHSSHPQPLRSPPSLMALLDCEPLKPWTIHSRLKSPTRRSLSPFTTDLQAWQLVDLTRLTQPTSWSGSSPDGNHNHLAKTPMASLSKSRKRFNGSQSYLSLLCQSSLTSFRKMRRTMFVRANSRRSNLFATTWLNPI
jgi:hypothetical protein